MMMKKKCTTMLVVLLGMAFFVDGLSVNNLEDDKRMNVKTGDGRAEKRNLWQFRNMIKCATGRSAWDYNNYGNWCGSGGSGVPVDGVDRCCRAHDWCYDNHDSCNPKTNYYRYSTSGKHPSCTISCGGSTQNDQCERNVCSCDKVAAECFASNTYNNANKHS